jgi:hypothetical protein
MKGSETLRPEQSIQARDSTLPTWLQIRPDSAVEWASQLPPGPQRDSATRWIATHYVFSSDESASDWFRKLTAADRAIARELIETIAMAYERRPKFLQALESE